MSDDEAMKAVEKRDGPRVARIQPYPGKRGRDEYEIRLGDKKLASVDLFGLSILAEDIALCMRARAMRPK